MNNKILFLINAFILIFLISLTSTSAYSYIYGSDLFPMYNYYDDEDDKYDHIPTVTGPFPRGYLWHRDAENGKDVDFLFDDYNHYDEFIGYKDLDLFYPDGRIEVIRNHDSRELDLSHIPEGTKTFGKHVYGYIPGPEGDCVMYRKHYHHEHPWDLEIDEYEFGYEYGYEYGYYTPFLAYRNTPVQRHNCQSISACEYRYCGKC